MTETMKTIITLISLSTILACLVASAQTQQRATGGGLAALVALTVGAAGDASLDARKYMASELQEAIR